MSVATDGSDLYNSDRERIMATHFAGGFDDTHAVETFDTHLMGVPTEAMEMDEATRNRVFNLGYFTWVEQQGVNIPDFEMRRDQGWWDSLRPLIGEWDTMIEDFNAATGVTI